MQKERKQEETLEDYKKRLHDEKNALRLYIRGRVFCNPDVPYAWRA